MAINDSNDVVVVCVWLYLISYLMYLPYTTFTILLIISNK